MKHAVRPSADLRLLTQHHVSNDNAERTVEGALITHMKLKGQGRRSNKAGSYKSIYCLNEAMECELTNTHEEISLAIFGCLETF